MTATCFLPSSPVWVGGRWCVAPHLPRFSIINKKLAAAFGTPLQPDVCSSRNTVTSPLPRSQGRIFLLSSPFLMREKALDHMASLHAPSFPHFLKHLALCFVLIAACSYVYALSSVFSTILVMVLPTSLFFALYKRRELQEPNTAETPQATGRAAFKIKIEESGTSELYESSINGVAGVLSSPSKPAASGDEAEEILLDSVDHIPACSDSSMSDDESADHIPASTDGPASDEESSVEDLDRTPTPSETDTSSDSSISDEEGLIEIALQDGHPLVAEGAKNTAFRRSSQGYPSVFSPPEMVLRQQWLPELFAEMNEEENLIEIDIAVGSVKCSRLEIKA